MLHCVGFLFGLLEHFSVAIKLTSDVGWFTTQSPVYKIIMKASILSWVSHFVECLPCKHCSILVSDRATYLLARNSIGRNKDACSWPRRFYSRWQGKKSVEVPPSTKRYQRQNVCVGGEASARFLTCHLLYDDKSIHGIPPFRLAACPPKIFGVFLPWKYTMHRRILILRPKVALKARVNEVRF